MVDSVSAVGASRGLAAAPTDKITRVTKGSPGADILFEVLYKGASCGRIIVESKNRQDFKISYVAKLRLDQVEAGAEHAILASMFFPEHKKEMCIESDVIVVSPARVVYVIQLLRKRLFRNDGGLLWLEFVVIPP